MNDDTKIILSLLRDIQSKIADSMDELEKQVTAGLANMDSRLKALEEQHRSNFSSLHSISGHIHTKVSADEALPVYLLNKEIMLDFMTNYPKNGPSPLTAKRQMQLAHNHKTVPEADAGNLRQGYSAIRDQSDPANTDLYYFREMEVLLAKELQSRGEDLFKDHEPMDPRLRQELKEEKFQRDDERQKEIDKGMKR